MGTFLGLGALVSLQKAAKRVVTNGHNQGLWGQNELNLTPGPGTYGRTTLGKLFNCSEFLGCFLNCKVEITVIIIISLS